MQSVCRETLAKLDLSQLCAGPKSSDLAQEIIKHVTEGGQNQQSNVHPSDERRQPWRKSN